MMRSLLTAAAVSGALAFGFASSDAIAADNNVFTAPPQAPYKAVSSLVKLPDFIPGLGQLFVDPDTLPAGPFIEPGQTVKWVNNDEGNVHTATAYHPDYNKPLRIPAKAKPWDSGYLMPGESFSITFTESGVYDYFCIPHEQAGMTGRIVAGKVDGDARPYEESNTLLPKNAVANLPTVADIIRHDTID